MQSIRGASDIAEFILKNYSGKVVEVGVGFVGDVASRLGGLNVIATDTMSHRLDDLYIVMDDIFSPKKEIYEDANLLYSIRPPLEVQIAMGALAKEIGADVLIRPLGDEVADLPGFTRSLINVGEAMFYVFKPDR
ncbi:MAG: UPF0146 family protein [Methanotrichaceae archaeon]